MKVYLSGPTTGIENFNFPAFETYTQKLRSAGLLVLSPHELDHGKSDGPWSYYINRDLNLLLNGSIERIYLMPGWSRSRGATLEKLVAEAIGIAVWDADTMQPYTESITQEAHRLVGGDRGASYGHPLEDFGRTAAMASSVLAKKLKEPLVAEDIGLLMICVKLSRQVNYPKRDNLVDIAGYAQTLDLISTKRGESK